MIETEDGIATPDGDDEYALTVDLAAMATTIQEALKVRGNARTGTQAQRIAQTSTLPNGTLWKDSNGERVLWARDQGQWARIWPKALSRVERIGSRGQKLGVPFFTQDWLREDGSVNTATWQVYDGNPDAVSSMISGWLNGSFTNAIYFFRDGRVSVNADDSKTRFLPFATATGITYKDVSGPDKVTTLNLSFPSGRFTQDPNVQITLVTDYPQGYSYSVTHVSTSGARVHIHRVPSGSFNLGVSWHAIQPGG